MAQACWQAGWAGCQLTGSARSSSSWGQLPQTGWMALQLLLLLMPACSVLTSMMLLWSMRGMVGTMMASLAVTAMQQHQQQWEMKKWQMHNTSSSSCKMRVHLTGLHSQAGRLHKGLRRAQQ
jgi:hypothetical protein